MSESKETAVNKMAEELIFRAVEVETKETELNVLKKSLRSLENKMASQMVDEDVNKIGVHGVTFSTLEISNYSLDRKELGEDAEWDNEMFFNFLREVGEGEAIKNRETIHHSTRKAILDGLIKKGVDLPNYINIKGFTKLQYNRNSIKGKAVV